MEQSLDMKLIPEFDGNAKQSVAEWLEKLELVCKLRGIVDVSSMIPLRLIDGSFCRVPASFRVGQEDCK